MSDLDGVDFGGWTILVVSSGIAFDCAYGYGRKGDIGG